MTINVLEEYIKITRNEINDYMKLIFERKFLKRISDQYIDAYINVRFYNFYNKDENLSFRKNYLNVIKETEKNIIEDYPENTKLIENMGLFYYYILYFDRISYRKNSKETVEKLYKMRKRILQKDNEDFKEEFYKTYRDYLRKKIKFIKQFEDDEFFIKIIPYKKGENVGKVIIQNNVKLPKVYSNWAIDKAFNTGIISEDKLLVEYNLVSGESAIESDLASASYTINGTVNDVAVSGTKIENASTNDIPESASVAGTTVTFAAEDKATNSLSGGVFVVKVDKTAPTVIEFIIDDTLNVLPMVPPGNTLKDMIMEEGEK